MIIGKSDGAETPGAVAQETFCKPEIPNYERHKGNYKLFGLQLQWKYWWPS